jgi:hypothetical protein
MSSQLAGSTVRVRFGYFFWKEATKLGISFWKFGVIGGTKAVIVSGASDSVVAASDLVDSVSDVDGAALVVEVSEVVLESFSFEQPVNTIKTIIAARSIDKIRGILLMICYLHVLIFISHCPAGQKAF